MVSLTTAGEASLVLRADFFVIFWSFWGIGESLSEAPKMDVRRVPLDGQWRVLPLRLPFTVFSSTTLASTSPFLVSETAVSQVSQKLSKYSVIVRTFLAIPQFARHFDCGYVDCSGFSQTAAWKIERREEKPKIWPCGCLSRLIGCGASFPWIYSVGPPAVGS